MKQMDMSKYLPCTARLGTEIAKEWFTKALTVEPEKAQENLNKMK